MPSTIVILGTGGTIAGNTTAPTDNVGYRAAQRSVTELLATLPSGVSTSPEWPIETEQVAQVDSKDMDHATWQRLAQRVQHHLVRPEVAAVVITHGTDTLEETAWFLQRVLAPTKPVVLAAAMRPATALLSDGPQNLLDALAVAREPGACGVVAVLAGTVHGAHDVRKVHTYRLDAFDSGDAGPIARIEEGRLRRHRTWPVGRPLGLARIERNVADWPRVEIVISHAGARGETVDALVEAGVQGIVVAGTGNGTLHRGLEAGLRRALAMGVPVWRTTRCVDGVLVDHDDDALPAAAGLSAWQARIELMLSLMAAAPGAG